MASPPKTAKASRMVILRLAPATLHGVANSPPCPSLDASADKSLEQNAGSTPSKSSLAPPKVRKTGQSSAKKRAPPSIDPNKPMKERARPGPKKKARLDDGSGSKPNGTSSHRLGPKANTGNINANLRALDRSGKPCRRWQRKPLQIRSFTGNIWGLPSWKGTPREIVDGKSGSPSSSDIKPQASSAMASEPSISHVDHVEPGPTNVIESSPAPPPSIQVT
ncbi:hypothetical protein K470DRAFT_272748 [Piedraia hortae CBS 480.64]|uniref:DUF1711-domain-containing protein n=1 Tax=Piedraia hortae CBS 480.64 TaxID=1314780 RepID=A0A6A7BT31_9PEZI|nr:hypothetical protein K470DRAFT_272748 [Piedraia hortae CBS 480.64]